MSWGLFEVAASSQDYVTSNSHEQLYGNNQNTSSMFFSDCYILSQI